MAARGLIWQVSGVRWPRQGAFLAPSGAWNGSSPPSAMEFRITVGIMLIFNSPFIRRNKIPPPFQTDAGPRARVSMMLLLARILNGQHPHGKVVCCWHGERRFQPVTHGPENGSLAWPAGAGLQRVRDGSVVPVVKITRWIGVGSGVASPLAARQRMRFN